MKDKAESEKLVYKLDEVARLTQVDKKVIESWEKDLYFIQSGQTRAGHKIFRKKDLSIFLRLKELLENEGLTLAGAKRQLEEELGVKKTTAVHPDRMKKVLYNVREQLKDIASTLED
jgi:DNA-binding transcriptional MerR regulator